MDDPSAVNHRGTGSGRRRGGAPGRRRWRSRTARSGSGSATVADERRRPRGGRRSGSRCSPRWRRSSSSRSACRSAFGDRGARCSPAPTRSSASRTSGSSWSPSRDDPGAPPLRGGPRRRARRSGSACSSAASFAGRRRCRARCGRSRSRSTWAGRSSSAPSGWRLVPGHFAERHGLIVIIALGESIVAIGVGAEVGSRRRRGRRGRARHRRRRARSGGSTSTSSRWSPSGRLSNAAPGREHNEIARDSFSYLHFPMVAGIVLIALGLKKTLEHVDDPLKLVPAAALLGGTGALPARARRVPLRNVHRFSWQRLLAAVRWSRSCRRRSSCPRWSTLAILGATLAALIVYETRRFAEPPRPPAPPARSTSSAQAVQRARSPVRSGVGIGTSGVRAMVVAISSSRIASG